MRVQVKPPSTVMVLLYHVVCTYIISAGALRASYSFRVHILYVHINEQMRVKPKNRLIICNALQRS